MAAFLLADYISFFLRQKHPSPFSIWFIRDSLPFLITPIIYVYQKDKNLKYKKKT